MIRGVPHSFRVRRRPWPQCLQAPAGAPGHSVHSAPAGGGCRLVHVQQRSAAVEALHAAEADKRVPAA